jgi:hypothetical protein
VGGRTLWDMMTGRNEPVAPELRGYNPFGVRVGSTAGIDLLDYRDAVWVVREVWSWAVRVAAATHPMADYRLAAPDRSCVLRAVPRAGGAGVSVLLLEEYYPADGSGPAPYDPAVTPGLIGALDDPTGEFYKDRGLATEEKYWRLGGKVPLLATATVVMDRDGDGRVTDADVGAEPFTLWDFHRVTADEGGSDRTEYLYAQFGGHWLPDPGRVEGGDKSLVMYRGPEVAPTRVTIFGGK